MSNFSILTLFFSDVQQISIKSLFYEFPFFFHSSEVRAEIKFDCYSIKALRNDREIEIWLIFWCFHWQSLWATKIFYVVLNAPKKKPKLFMKFQFKISYNVEIARKQFAVEEKIKIARMLSILHSSLCIQLIYEGGRTTAFHISCNYFKYYFGETR